MMRKSIRRMAVTLLMLFFTVYVLSFKVSGELDLPVHNINTGLYYPTIQDAIDAPQTLNGHVIRVKAGTYHENVVVNKSVSLIGENKIRTIIDGNNTGNVIWILADKVNITGFTIKNSASGKRYWEYGYAGIWVDDANQCNISYNIIAQNSDGVLLYFSNDNILCGNDFSLNTYYGIHLYQSTNNVILHNNVSNNTNGIYARCESNFNVFSGNIVSSNGDMNTECPEYGIRLGYCFNNTLSDNIVSNNEDGIWITGTSLYNVLSQNSIFSNIVDGIYVGSALENAFSGNNISANGKNGIYLDGSASNALSGNNISANGKNGIYFKYSVWNMISGNNISANGKNGIALFASAFNTLSSNTILSNKEDGVHADTSRDNIISFNSVLNHDIGIRNHLSNNNVFANNTVSNNTHGIQVCCNSGGNKVSCNNVFLNEDGIYINSSSNNFITDNTIFNNTRGVQLNYGSTDNGVLGNSAFLNKDAMYISSSSGNTFADNIISSNARGIFLADNSNRNRIFYNEFRNNTEQAFIEAGSDVNEWDNGAEGNYWSDYTGVDFYYGSYQNMTGSDGIGDTPYIIDENNEDKCPLIDPRSRVRIFYINLTMDTASLEFNIVIISNCTMAGFNLTKTNLNFRVTGPSETTGFCNVTIPKELLDVGLRDEWNVTVGNIVVTPTVAGNLTHTFIYFTFNQSTQTVNISGTIPFDRSKPVPIWDSMWFWGMILIIPGTLGFSYLIFRLREGVFQHLQKLVRQYVWDTITHETFEKKVKELKERADVRMHELIDEYLRALIAFERAAREKKKMEK